MSVADVIVRQAEELLKSEDVKQMLAECETEDEKLMKLAIASVYSLVKVNQ